MTKNSAQAVLTALNKGGVRYLVAGGLAVNAHGVLRYTADLDLVILMEPKNIRKAFAVLAFLGYKPTLPVTVDQFADPKIRQGWIRNKNMRVLQFYSEEHRETGVDVFVEEPFTFDEEYERALIKGLGGSDIPFVSLGTLLNMKASAGRPKDLGDIDDLRRIKESHGKKKKRTP